MLQLVLVLLSSVHLHDNESPWLPMSLLGSFWPSVVGAGASCVGTSCGMCERRFGCLTEAWGKCCVQFFQLNGKRSSPADRKALQRKRGDKRSAYHRRLFGRFVTSRLHRPTTRHSVRDHLPTALYSMCVKCYKMFVAPCPNQFSVKNVSFFVLKNGLPKNIAKNHVFC